MVKKYSIKPVETLTMADRVELRLIEFLKENKFKPGDSIPKEIEFAEVLGVSRNVVREALSRFRMLGLIESKKRRGMVMSSPDPLKSIERVLDPNILEFKTLKEIFEFRLVLEMGIAELLFLRKTDLDVIKLEKIVDNSMNLGDKPFRLENEILFHSKLYHISGNETLIRFQKMLMPVFEFVIEEESKANGRPPAGETTHKDLVGIIKLGTPAEFREAMFKHLKPHFDRLQKS